MAYKIGRYEIVKRLGTGVMGEVYQCHDPQTNQQVAIKILSEELSKNQRAVERFKREIRQAIQLEHPGLIQAYTAGEHNGRHYYVMEFVEGTTVKKELLSRGPYDEYRAIEIIIQLSKALEYAAQYSIIHRDIKPENIMITIDGKAKLCDMGLAKSMDSQHKLTLMGTVLGTPNYMSPEQALGGDNLDTRSDIFSLGATFYHMLTGNPPFDGPDPVSIITNLLESEPVPIQQRCPKISDATCAVINKMMVKDREQRYNNFTELIEDLYKLKKHKKTSAQLSGHAPSKSSHTKRFPFSYAPSEKDVIFGRIAIHNKILSTEMMEKCLDRQENLAMIGVELDLGDILVEREFLTPNQKAALDKARVDFLLNRADEMFLKIAINNKYLTEKEKAECLKIQKTHRQGVVPMLIERGIISDEKRERILATMKSSINGEEEKMLLKAGLEADMITQAQAEKCSRIYQNNLVMGRYRDMALILTEKGFVPKEYIVVILRAVRRSLLTGTPPGVYIKAQRQRVEGPTKKQRTSSFKRS